MFAPITALHFHQVAAGGVIGNLVLTPVIELAALPLGLAGAPIVGPMLVSGLAHAFGLTSAKVPLEVLIVAQISVGVLLGWYFAGLPVPPESVPINQLVEVKGTPLADGSTADVSQQVDSFEFIRTIAVARILMPLAQVRLSAGRQEMSDETQAMAFMAGANSIFYGEKLLTTGNSDVERDRSLLARLKINAETQEQTNARSGCC